MAKKEWFQSAVEEGVTKNLGGWRKSLSASTRRDRALASRPSTWSLQKRRLSAARALQALANVTKDAGTRRAASSDAKYFFRLYNRYK